MRKGKDYSDHIHPHLSSNDAVTPHAPCVRYASAIVEVTLDYFNFAVAKNDHHQAECDHPARQHQRE
jgi:hypothetical protein